MDAPAHATTLASTPDSQDQVNIMATENSNNDPKPFNFLGLPKELRLMVYERLSPTVKHHTFRRPHNWRYGNVENQRFVLVESTIPTAILLTCRLVHSEAKTLVHCIDLGTPRIMATVGWIRPLSFMNNYLNALLTKARGKTLYGYHREDDMLLASWFKVELSAGRPRSLGYIDMKDFDRWVAKAIPVLAKRPLVEVVVLKERHGWLREGNGRDRKRRWRYYRAIRKVSEDASRYNRSWGNQAEFDLNIFLEPGVKNVGKREDGIMRVLYRDRKRKKWLPAPVPVTVLKQKEWEADWMAD